MKSPNRRIVRALGAGLATLATTAGLALVPTAQAAPGNDADLGRLSSYIEQVRAARKGEVIPGRYFVAVSGAPIAKGGSSSAITASQQRVRAAARSAGIAIQVDRSYRTVWNGMTVSVDDAQAAKLQAVPGVTGVYPVVEVRRPADRISTNDVTANDMTGVSIAQSELGWTGKGIKVGVIDSGIDIDHPDLGGGGVAGKTAFPTAKVVGGWDFVGDDYNAKTNPKPVPDANPDDCGGHGSHVSGIIAGQGDPATGGVRGVAPDATLYGYRVFGCTGSTDTDIILAALERAGNDKVDVVNMSLGDPYMTWPDYPDAAAADALAARGTIVVDSAGNSGEFGGMSTGSPSVGARSISVASFENTTITAPALKVGDRRVGYTNATGAPLAPATGSLPLVVGSPLDGCAPLAAVPAGSAVLLQRGTCGFRAKAEAAVAAGAKALVIANNQPGTVNPTVEGDPAIAIPVVMISQEDGEALKALAAAGGQDLAWTAETVTRPNPEAGLVSSFSSWGLAADLSLKPDLGAPGGNIWSTVPLEKGAYESMSGTSMASPHVAGVVALLLQAHPELKGQVERVRALLQNTANPENVFSFAPDAGLTEMVTRQGAGLVQADDAILSKQWTDVGKISLGDGDLGVRRTTVTVHNDDDRAVTYALSNLTGVGHLGNSDPVFDLFEARVAMPQTLSVPAHSSASFEVAIQAPADAPAGFVYGGWVQLKAEAAQQLSIPYAGMAGDYQSLPILTNAVDGRVLPSLGRMDGEDLVLLPKDGSPAPSFTMTGTDVPVIAFHLEYPVSDLRIDLYKVAANGTRSAKVGNVLTLGQFGRDESLLSLPWDGSYDDLSAKHTTKVVKAGRYQLEIKALPALADGSVAANWQTWSSQPIVVKGASVATNGNGKPKGNKQQVSSIRLDQVREG